MLRKYSIFVIIQYTQAQFWNNIFSNRDYNRQPGNSYLKCKENEIKTNYLNDKTCSNRAGGAAFMQMGYRPGCECKPGFVRYNSECMPEKFCPCESNEVRSSGFLDRSMTVFNSLLGNFWGNSERSTNCVEKPCFKASRFWYDSGLRRDKPVCDLQGFFETRVCEGANCVCHNRLSGNVVPGSEHTLMQGSPVPNCKALQISKTPEYRPNPFVRPDPFGIPPTMTPPKISICQQEKAKLAAQGLRQSLLPSCDRNGNFDYQQQGQNGAYCADPISGMEIPGTRNSGGKIDCRSTVELCTAGRIYETCSFEVCTTDRFKKIGYQMTLESVFFLKRFVSASTLLIQKKIADKLNRVPENAYA